MISIVVFAFLLWFFSAPLLAPYGRQLGETLVWAFRCFAMPAWATGQRPCAAWIAARPGMIAGMRAQDYPGPDGQRPQTSWIWEQLGAVLGVACFIVFGALDWQLLSVTIDSIFHLAGGPLPQVGKLVGLSIVLAAGYTIFELFNILQLSPVRRPWCFCSAIWRKRLAILAVATFIATLIAGIAVAVYRQLQINATHQTLVQTVNDPTHLHLVSPPEPLSSILLFTFVVLMWGVLALVSGGSGLHVLPLFGGLVVLLKLLSTGLLYLAFGLCYLVAAIISCLCIVTVLLTYLLLSPFQTLWNWTCSFPAAQHWHLSPIDPYPFPPFLADELAQELFPATLLPYTPVRTSQNTTNKELAMPRALPRFVTLLGGGRYAITALDSLRVATDRLGATAEVLAQGCIATTAPAGRLRTAAGHDKVIDLTPTDQDGGNTVDRDPDSQTHAQGHALADNAIQTLFNAALSYGQIIWFGALDALMQLTEDLLEEITARQSGQTILAVSMIPSPDRYTARLQAGLQSYVNLHAAGIVSATLLPDERSPLARAISPEAQQDFLSTLVASLIRAPRDWEQNPSITDVARAMGREAETGLVGLSMASECVAPGKQLSVYSGIRRLIRRLPARGKGDLGDIIRQGIKAATRALTEPACRAIDETIETDRPFYVVLTTPLHSTDSRWVEFVRATSKWLASTYPNAVPIYASGQGTPDPRTPGSYWIQASVLFALPAVPQPVQEILERKGLVALPEVIEIVSNGTPTEVTPALVTTAPVVS
ncbi:MAG: hypothetical protein NVS2B16_32580 [Chloroflexota bacterium]